MKSLFKGIKRIIILLFLICIFIAGYIIADGYKLYKSVTDEVSIKEKINEIRSNPSYVKIDEIPKDYLNAVVSIEDKRFYGHFGVDIYSIGRALLSNLENKKIIGGGSTITQQLAKNLYFEQKKVLSRKVAEVFVSMDLEEEYTKDDILELYINIIYYGIGKASNGYFSKEPKELDINEITLLAGIPNAPSVYQLSNDSIYTYQRQIIVINSMLDTNSISQDVAQELIKKIRESKGI